MAGSSLDPPALDAIRAEVVGAYGSLTEPSWHFVASRRTAAPYAALVAALEDELAVVDETDPNGTVGLDLALLTRCEAPSVWRLCLSYVGPYAALLRRDATVVAPGAADPAVEEERLLEILAEHGVHALDRETLEAPVPLRGLTRCADPERVRLFQVLFADCEEVPWGLPGDGPPTRTAGRGAA